MSGFGAYLVEVLVVFDVEEHWMRDVIARCWRRDESVERARSWIRAAFAQQRDLEAA